MVWLVIGIIIIVGLIIMVIYDQLQTKHAILKNFPIIGHFRYWLEALGPELRQYIVTNNDEERPFSRDQRRWVYASAKRENNYFGFGTDNDLDTASGYVIIKHNAIPLPEANPGEFGYGEHHPVPCAKIMGKARNRKHAFRPDSIINVSAMSFGSLSGPAIEALNRGCAIAGALHNTGEGGISSYHKNGANLIWQIGSGYFGCRDDEGNFSLDRLAEQCKDAKVCAIEIKLSQGAKPGIGGVLPGAKVTPEIADIRGIPVGKDCISPSAHSAFSDADSLLDLVESIADRTGLPVGIKSAVGELDFWMELAQLMKDGSRGVDFITIDGGEGGTGAGPLVFTDHVALPFRIGFPRVYSIFAQARLTDSIVFIGSGRLGFPERAMLAMGLGCDMINVAREAMLAIGCIQAQNCHTGHCPTGVATQNKWLMHGLDPTNKAARLANYFATLRKELTRVSRACGHIHPALVPLQQFEILTADSGALDARAYFEYQDKWGMASPESAEQLVKLRINGH
ncbi:MAG: FMN-binding glutamate synthase family protein [Phycisphaerales bacterium]|nr:FMN-binding glutamate synthase family protein [Phycisphaerales bacterium]